MAYTLFDPAVPDAATDNGLAFCDNTRLNLKAVRDAVIAGTFFGWNFAKSGGTAEEPGTITYTKGTEIVRGVLTWGTTGGADGNVSQAVYSYSANSGTSYDTIGTVTMAYDVDGNVTSTTWS